MAAVAAGALAAPAPAFAAAGVPAPNLVADPAAADRDFVRWLSVHDPREAVQSAARSALGGGTATAFIASGYQSALTRAADSRAQQLGYANQMAAAHPAADYPWVNAAARRAANGSDADLAEFAAGEYQAALDKDLAKVAYDSGAAQVTEADHDFVFSLSRGDLGETVQYRARGAVTDADVAEFLRYGWLSAATIDADAFRAQYVAEEWQQWRAAKDATARAVELDRAARAGTASPMAAMQAWEEVKTRSARQPAGWAARERLAGNRAIAWGRTATLADDTGPQALFGDLAPGVSQQWSFEIRTAVEQSNWWNGLVRYAQAAVSELMDTDW